MAYGNVKYTEPASGTNVRFDDDGAGSKTQAVKLLDPTAGSIAAIGVSANPLHSRMAPGTRQTWVMQSTFNALAANKLFFDLFNASGSGVVIRVHQVLLQKNMAAVTGVACQFDLNFTTAVGTGGSSLTPVKLDSGNDNLPAEVTARHAASGGATLGSLIVSRFFHSEETNVAAQAQEAFPFWPAAAPYSAAAQDIVLREGEGLTLKQITATTAGTYNATVVFSVE